MKLNFRVLRFASQNMTMLTSRGTLGASGNDVPRTISAVILLFEIKHLFILCVLPVQNIAQMKKEVKYQQEKNFQDLHLHHYSIMFYQGHIKTGD